MSVIEQKIVLKAIDEASRQIKSVSDSAKKGSEEVIRANEKAKISYDNLKHSIGLAVGAFTAVSAVAVVAGKALVDHEIQINRIERALKVYTGSMSGASQEISFLKDQANRLGLEFSSTALAYSQLAVASKGTALTSRQVKDIFIATSEAGSALGLSAYDLEGALRAIQQMMSKGTVQAEELRGQLGERIPGAFGMASRAMGVTEKELGKMLETGQVLAVDLLPKLAKEMTMAFGPEAEAGAKGMAGQVNSLKNSFFELKEEFLNGGMSNLLVGMFEQGTKAIKGYTDEIKRALGGELSNLSNFTSDFVEKEKELTESVMKSSASHKMNAKNLSSFNPELERSRKELVENKKALDNLMGAGYSEKFLQKSTTEQLKYSSALDATIKNLKSQEQAILKTEETTKKAPTSSISSPVKGGSKNGSLVSVGENDPLTKEILKSEELRQRELESLKTQGQEKISLQYEIDRMIIEAQAEGKEKEKELLLLDLKEKSDIEINEKALHADYVTALHAQTANEISKIDEEWTKKEKAESDARIAQSKMEADRKRELQFQTASIYIQIGKTLFGNQKKFALLNKALAMGDIVVNTSRAVMQALTSPPGPPWTTPLAVATGALGAAQLVKAGSVKYASRGADFVTNGPQMMMVGENGGGRERVQVTPLSSPNYEGPRNTSNNTTFGNISINVNNGADLVSMLERNPDRFNQLLKNGLKRGAFKGVL